MIKPISLFDKIKFHFDNKKFARIIRQVAEDWTEISRGYIVAYSSDFIILQENDDFEIKGYCVLPVDQIIDLRYNSHDKFYDKIVVKEKEINKVFLSHKIDLTNWQTIFRTIKKTGLNVIVECEDPAIDTFTIGPIIKTTKSLVYILYFDAAGFIDEKPISVNYKKITKVLFDDRYSNIFSKYVRPRKKKATT